MTIVKKGGVRPPRGPRNPIPPSERHDVTQSESTPNPLHRWPVMPFNGFGQGMSGDRPQHTLPSDDPFEPDETPTSCEERLMDALQRIAILETALKDAPLGQFGLQGPHTEAKDCPTWYDYCGCTVEALRSSLKREQAAETTLRGFRDALRALKSTFLKMHMDIESHLSDVSQIIDAFLDA